jgi:hypothetical protein
MPVFKLFQWIKVTCLSDPGFSAIQSAKRISDDLLQFFFMGWWFALLLTIGNDAMYSSVIIPCLGISILSMNAQRFLARIARQTFTLLLGMGSLVLVTRFSNELATVIAFVERHIGTIVIMAVIAAILTYLQRMFALFEADMSNEIPHRPYPKPTMIGPYTKLQSLDAQFVACHETGHAIVLALFPHRPHDIEVVMTADVMGNTNEGWCSGVGIRTHCMPRQFLELRMILLLAGREGEFLFAGEYSISGTSDNEKWLVAATEYLESDPKVIFFRKPASKQEFDFNADQLEKLKAQHVDVARRLLLANQPIFEKIRDGMLEKSRVHGKELLDLLAHVKTVEGCPSLSARVDQALKHDFEKRRLADSA